MAAEGRARQGCTRTEGAAAASTPAGASSALPVSLNRPARAETLPSTRPHLRPLSPTESAFVPRAPPSSSPNLVHPWPSSHCPIAQAVDLGGGLGPSLPLVTSSYLSCLVDSTTLSGTFFHSHSHCPRLGLSIPGLDHGSGLGGRGWSWRLWPV